MRLRRKGGEINVIPEGQQTGWEARVTDSTMYRNDYWYDRDNGHKSVPVQGEISVALFLNGKRKMSYGTLKITDPEFEDKVTTLKAEAEEKAAVLNAVGAA